MASGLSAYLEDIVSDEEPLEEPPASPQATPTVSDSARSKEELLQLMERVDREITTAEQQITILEKKQVRERLRGRVSRWEGEHYFVYLLYILLYSSHSL